MNGEERQNLQDDISEVINRHSAENLSDTPGFLLAGFLGRCFDAVSHIINEREKWHNTRSPKSEIKEPPNTAALKDVFLAGWDYHLKTIDKEKAWVEYSSALPSGKTNNESLAIALWDSMLLHFEMFIKDDTLPLEFKQALIKWRSAKADVS